MFSLGSLLNPVVILLIVGVLLFSGIVPGLDLSQILSGILPSAA